jgi:hypothetical protein
MYTLDWQSFNIGVAAALFFTYILADGLYAYYTISVSRQRAFQAATSSAFIHILLAVGVLSYVQNFLYVIPIAFGSWVGIYIVVSHDLKVGSEKLSS